MLAMRAFTGAGWLVGSRFLGRLIDFFTLLVLARALTPADFGLMALAMSLVAIVDMVLEVPVTQALVRLKQIDKSHLDTGFTLSILRGLLITLVVIAAAWPFSRINNDPHLIPVVLALALAPVARGLASPGLILFIRDLGFGRTFLLEISGKIVAVCLAMATLLLGGTYWTLVVNFVASPVVGVVVSYILAPYRPALSLSRRSDFLHFAGWFTSAQIVSAINWQFDRILLGATGGKEVLGRYAVASDLAVVPTQSLIGPALQPIMSAFSRIHGDDDRLRAAFLKAARFSMLISVPCSLGIALVADLLVEVMLGPKWQDATNFLRLLSLSVIATPYFQTLYSLGLAMGRPELVFRTNLLDLVIRSSCVVVGYYYWASSGVAEARVAAAMVMAVVFIVQVRRLIAIGIADQLFNLWKIGVAAALMSLGVIGLRAKLAELQISPLLELAVVAAAGVALYLALLACLGVKLVAGSGRLELVDRWWRR